MNIGSGIAFYYKQKISKFLSVLNVSASYQKVVGIKKNIAQSVLKRRAENDNVFIPLNISVDRSITFAIDNIDLKIDRYTWWKTSAAWNGYCGILTKI